MERVKDEEFLKNEQGQAVLRAESIQIAANHGGVTFALLVARSLIQTERAIVEAEKIYKKYLKEIEQ